MLVVIKLPSLFYEYFVINSVKIVLLNERPQLKVSFNDNLRQRYSGSSNRGSGETEDNGGWLIVVESCSFLCLRLWWLFLALNLSENECTRWKEWFFFEWNSGLWQIRGNWVFGGFACALWTRCFVEVVYLVKMDIKLLALLQSWKNLLIIGLGLWEGWRRT